MENCKTPVSSGVARGAHLGCLVQAESPGYLQKATSASRLRESHIISQLWLPWVHQTVTALNCRYTSRRDPGERTSPARILTRAEVRLFPPDLCYQFMSYFGPASCFPWVVFTIPRLRREGMFVRGSFGSPRHLHPLGPQAHGTGAATTPASAAQPGLRVLRSSFCHWIQCL